MRLKTYSVSEQIGKYIENLEESEGLKEILTLLLGEVDVLTQHNVELWDRVKALESRKEHRDGQS